MERQASSLEYSDSSEIVSDPETESDFVAPSPLSPILLTLSEEKRVEQCTRIGLVATHKCSSDILTEDDRREIAAIRASLGMLPRQSEEAARNGGHSDEQEVRDCVDTYQDSTRHQKEVSEDEDSTRYQGTSQESTRYQDTSQDSTRYQDTSQDSTRYQDTSQDSTRQFNEEVNQKLILTSYNKTGIGDDAQHCDLRLETEDKGQIPREHCGPITEQSPPSRVENSKLSASVGAEWSDSASDVMKVHKWTETGKKTTSEDERRSRSEDKKYCRRQQKGGQRGQHTVTANNEWSEETDNYSIGDRPLEYCGRTVQSKVYGGAGTTVKCRGPQRNSKKCAYSKLTDKLRPIRPSIHPAIDRRRYVADSGWLVCALCRQQFHIGQEGLRQELFPNSSLFRGSQLLTQHQASFMPCRPRVYHSTALPLTISQQCTIPSLLPPYVRACDKPLPQDSYFQQYMMKKRRHTTDWNLPLCSIHPPSSLHWRTAHQSLGYFRAHTKVSRSLHLRPPPPPVARGYITVPKTYANMFHSRYHK